MPNFGGDNPTLTGLLKQLLNGGRVILKVWNGRKIYLNYQ